VDVWIFALLAIISCALTLKGGKIFRSSSSRSEATLEIKGKGGVATLRTLMDSGNLATEPISGKSVVFASLDACRGALTNEEFACLSSKNDITDMPISLAMRVRLIPSSSVAGERLLPALRFESTVLKCGKKRKELNVYVALLKNASFGGYDAIASQEL